MQCHQKRFYISVFAVAFHDGIHHFGHFVQGQRSAFFDSFRRLADQVWLRFQKIFGKDCVIGLGQSLLENILTHAKRNSLANSGRIGLGEPGFSLVWPNSGH